MGPSPRGTARALIAVIAAATLATACARGSGTATLADTRGSVDTAAALEVVAEAEGADALPTPSMPILLGLDDPGAAAEPLAFDLHEFENGAPRRTGSGNEAVATAESGPAPGSNEVVPVPDTTVGEPEVVPTEPPDAPPEAPEGEDSGIDDGAADDEVDDDGDAPDRDLPPPPPAPLPGGPPEYDDPSPLIVEASGRPFELLDPAVGPARGVTADTITVGGVVTRTLVGNPHRDAVCDGAAARFGQANAHGELSRRIDFIDCYDDTGQSEISAGVAQALVRQEAFAIVPLATPAFFDEATLTEQGVVYIGDERLPGFCGRWNPVGFDFGGAEGCPVLDARGYLTLVEPVLSAYGAAVAPVDPDPWVAVTYVVADSPQGEVTLASRLFEAELLEVPPPTPLAVLPTAGEGPAPDWSAVVGEILDTDPQVVILEGPAVGGLPAAIRGAGFDGRVVLVGVVDPVAIADTESRLELAPLTVISPGLDLASRSTTGWGSMTGAAAAIGIAEDDVGLDFIEGYLAADFFVRAVAATPEPLSAPALANTVNAGWWYPGIDGVSCGSWWPASHYIAAPCVSVSAIEVFTAVPVPLLGLVETAPQVGFNLVPE